MSDLVRIVYLSQASFDGDRGDGIHPEVSRILSQSRRNNARSGIVGALHYADGHFLQVLEGPRTAVEALVQRLARDPRHQRFTVVRSQAIDAASFASWSMKFVPSAADVRALLAQAGQDRFDPFAFDAATLDRFVGLLHGEPAADPTDDGTGGGRRAWPLLLVAALALAGAVALLAMRGG